jgi:hypothetical protein
VAYSDDPAPAARDLLQLDAVPFRGNATDTQGLAGRGDGFAVLASRGSERIDQHPADWVTDADAIQVTQDPFTGRVHQGFSGAATGAWSVLTPVLRQVLSAGAAVGADDQVVPSFVTRHSLGGALALLATCRLAAGELPAYWADPAIRFNLRATYTFGVPRVGDPAFYGAYRVPPPTYRVVNNLSFRRSLNAPDTDHFIDSHIRALSG